MEHNDKIKKAFWITENMDREIGAHLKLDNCSSRSTAVDLASAMSELEAHEGNVWTIIYSLRREDTDRLEYDNADAWRALLMENAPTLAKSMKISLENFHWYAAFHDEGHHPHIHMMVWSDDPKEGFLTRDGIAAMRSKLTNAIFRDEMQQIYERKDVAYSDLVEAAKNPKYKYNSYCVSSRNALPQGRSR